MTQPGSGTYKVVKGVKGAMRLTERYFDSYTVALRNAKRHSESNSIGSYFARVYDHRGELLERCN